MFAKSAAELEEQLRLRVHELERMDADQRQFVWDRAIQPDLDDFIRLRLAEVAERENVRETAARAGISPGYVSMLTREDKARTASLAVIEDLGRAFPRDFGIVRQLLAAAPEAVRERMERDKSRKGVPARPTSAGLEEWSVTFHGQRRDEPVWRRLLRDFRGDGATQMVRVDSGGFPPFVEREDMVLLKPIADRDVRHGMLAIVHTPDGRHALRQYDARDHAWRPPNDAPGEVWSEGHVSLDGEVVGVLKARRL